MHYQRPDQLRKVAILMASLDDALAAELLSEFPPSEALKVRELVERLGEIDPEEQSDVLDEFRHSSQLLGSVEETTSHVAVEIDASLQRQMDRLANDPAEGEPTAAKDSLAAEAQRGDPRQRLLAEAAGPTLAKLLETEHPQTIALVLSRLSEQQAAETLNHLPAAKQAESIERQVYSLPASSEVVEELESQIATSIAEQRVQQEYFVAGSSLARRILALTSPAAKTAILKQIELRDRQVAESLAAPSVPERAPPEVSPARDWDVQEPLSSETPLTSTRLSTTQQASAVSVQEETDQPEETTPTLPTDSPDQYLPEQYSPTTPGTHEASCEPQEDYDPTILETIDGPTLTALFDAVGERATQLVLAAASDALLRRVFSQLPRREAKRLRQKIRQFGPTPLSDLYAAQQQILHLADRSGVLRTATA